jgi:hypothetical protein
MPTLLKTSGKTSKRQLANANPEQQTSFLQQAWQHILHAHVREIVLRRLEAIRTARGGNTKYILANRARALVFPRFFQTGFSKSQ